MSHFTTLLFVILLIHINCSNTQPNNYQNTGKPTTPSDMTEQITTGDITWFFDKAYKYGKFANGDYWVAGDTVVINRITPDFNGLQNGWEVNPIVEGPQGFSTDLNDFSSELVPNLPYKATPVLSIVKTVRSSKERGYICRQCIQSAAVLTIVSEPITDATLLRPPYVGAYKPMYSTKSFQTNLLPNLDPVSNTPSIHSFSEIHNLQLDHKIGPGGTELHPVNSYIDDYGAYIGKRNADIALRLMLNDPIDNKMPLLISYTQYGIDLLYMLQLGYRYEDGGGHRPGQKLPMVFAAVILNNEELKQKLKQSVHLFHEQILLTYNRDSTRILYGDNQGLNYSLYEENYWKVVHSFVKTGTSAGYKSYSDPYGYIDGGAHPGADYQFCCTSQPWKGSVLALKLMPSLAEVWNDTMTISYVERWVANGAWAQPDPCTPADSNWQNYGITFGPDGNGGCIKDSDSSDGIGRWPEKHGEYVDKGNYWSSFQKELWRKYYH